MNHGPLTMTGDGGAPPRDRIYLEHRDGRPAIVLPRALFRGRMWMIFAFGLPFLVMPALADAGLGLVGGMLQAEGEDYSTMDAIKLSGGVVPDDKEIWAHCVQRHRGIDQRLALLDRRCRDRHIHDVGAQPLAR